MSASLVHQFLEIGVGARWFRHLRIGAHPGAVARESLRCRAVARGRQLAQFETALARDLGWWPNELPPCLVGSLTRVSG